MSFIDAAAFALTAGTAGHALLQRARLQAGETVLITGAAGGCGSAAIQIAKAAGAQVIAVAGGTQKATLAARLGADFVIDHLTLEGERALSTHVAELTDGRGVDAVFDNVGTAVRELIRCLSWNGRLLVVGFAGGEIPVLPLNVTILKSISVIGIAYGASAIVNPSANRALLQQLFDWHATGTLRPHISTVVGPAEAVDAIRTLHDRTALGKVVVAFTPSPTRG